MVNASDQTILQLCERLGVAPEFLSECVEESIVEIHEVNGQYDLGNGTVLRLRQLERICSTLNVDGSGALLFLKLTRRIAELEEEVRLLRGKASRE